MARGTTTTYVTTFTEYTLIRPIGEGGTGFVFEVADSKGQHYALKILKRDGIREDRRRRFKNEIHFCQKTSHNNIMAVLDHGVDLDEGVALPFYVMPLYTRSLRHAMRSKLAPDAVLPLFSQILDGVEAAHLLGVCHRDLKPENILLDAQSTPVIADFGIAHFQQNGLYTAVETRACERLANFQYAAPEQRARGAPVDHRADIYALGLILNEMFTGEIPQGTGYATISSVCSAYPYLDDIVLNMIQQSPDKRPSKIADIKRELLARGNAFVTDQRLSELKRTVIPRSEVDDPLILDPVKLIDYEWGDNTLELILSKSVNSKWISAFQHMGNYTSLPGKGPATFTIRGDRATVAARDHEVQSIIDYFKQWLPTTTKKYEEIIREETDWAQRKKEADLQARIQEEEKRKRLRQAIKI